MLTVTCRHCNKTDFAPGMACKGCGIAYDDATQAQITVSTMMRENNVAGPVEPAIKRVPADIILTTIHEVPGRISTRALGIVTAEVVIGTNIFRDLFASLSDVFGGRSNSYQGVLRRAKLQAQAELRTDALAMGADAVVGIDLDYSEISGDGKSMLFLVMSGTAVKLGCATSPTSAAAQ